MSYVVIQMQEDMAPEEYSVPREFAEVLEWLILERLSHQETKWDRQQQAEVSAEGLGEESWFWNNAVLNYTGRVRLFGVTSPLGTQALLKLVAALGTMPEHLLRSGTIESLPRPGVPSGEL